MRLRQSDLSVLVEDSYLNEIAIVALSLDPEDAMIRGRGGDKAALVREMHGLVVHQALIFMCFMIQPRSLSTACMRRHPLKPSTSGIATG